MGQVNRIIRMPCSTTQSHIDSCRHSYTYIHTHMHIHTHADTCVYIHSYTRTNILSHTHTTSSQSLKTSPVQTMHIYIHTRMRAYSLTHTPRAYIPTYTHTFKRTYSLTYIPRRKNLWKHRSSPVQTSPQLPPGFWQIHRAIGSGGFVDPIFFPQFSTLGMVGVRANPPGNTLWSRASQSIAGCCRVLQSVAECCRVLPSDTDKRLTRHCKMLQCVTVCFSVHTVCTLQHTAVVLHGPLLLLKKEKRKPFENSNRAPQNSQKRALLVFTKKTQQFADGT